MNLAVVMASSGCLNAGMKHDRSVIVHGLDAAIAALAEAQAQGKGITLISAPGAALYAGCGWWRALVEAARSAHPGVPCTDILDCADGTGQALAALRLGLTRLVLWPNAPGRDAAVAIAESMGGFVLPAPPPADALVNDTRTSRGAAIGSLAKPVRGMAKEPPASGDKSRSPG
jgi:hypothetical protein